VVLLAGIVLAYAPTFQAGFTNYDDDIYITENPDLRAPFAQSLPRFFGSFRAANWHPLTWLSHALDVRLFGFEPLGHHLHNLALHLANTLLVILLLQMLSLGPVTTLLGGILFGLHPLQVESVAWLAQRKTLLCMLFSLVSLVAHVRRGRGGTFRSWYPLEIAALALALLAKPMAVAVPAAVVLIDLYGRRRLDRRWLAETAPPMLMAGAASIVTLFAQSGAIRAGAAVPFTDSPFVAAHGILFYLAKIAWPAGLSSLYPYPDHALGRLPIEFLTAPVTLAALAVAGWLATRGRAQVRLGLGIFLVTLLPAIQLVPVGSAHAADRYVYLPMLGIALALGGLIDPVIGRGTRSSRRGAAAIAALLGVAALLGWLSWQRAHAWKDGTTLWSDVLRRHPESAIARFYLGNARLDADDPGGALAEYQRALTAATPGLDTSRIHHNLGAALAALGRHDEAVAAFTRAIGRRDGVDSRLARATVLQYTGAPAAALADFEAVLAIRPDHPSARLGRGTTLLDLGRPREAIPDLEVTAAADPGNVVAVRALARARSLTQP
jgi:Tfp pilus assembly protein PilF